MRRNAGRKLSVRNRIFYSNTLMTLVTIAICAVIGVISVKLYWEQEERALEKAVAGKMTAPDAEELIKGLTVHNENFNLMFVIFTLLCIVTLLTVSGVFTSILSGRIMQPLELLEAGAERIRRNDYSTPVVCQGDLEFQRVSEAFNGMQQHLKDEKEKNARYEKARQEMIAGISHDLRNPLTAIRGSVKGVLDGVASSPEQRKRFLEAAYRRSGEMDQLLTELFYFSRLETGGVSVRMRELDLAEYLRHYFEVRRIQPEMDGVSVECDLPESVGPAVQADPEALGRILDNVLTNSRKYAAVAPLKLYVTVQREEGWQRVILQDNGAGVPEEKIGRIFDEFYRADESRNRKEGSGLGLYVVKRLAEKMGGRVSADQKCRGEYRGLAVILELKEGTGTDGRAEQNTDC